MALRRENVAREIYRTEHSYVFNLRLLVHVFLSSLDASRQWYPTSRIHLHWIDLTSAFVFQKAGEGRFSDRDGKDEDPLSTNCAYSRYHQTLPAHHLVALNHS